jgi:hypothetical protein
MAIDVLHEGHALSEASMETEVWTPLVAPNRSKGIDDTIVQ